MRGVTHLLFGCILLFGFLRYFDVANPLLAAVLVLLGSVLPDIDERKSLLGRKVPIIGWFAKHRGFFHSIFFLVVVMIVLSLFVDVVYVWSFGAAFVSHLILDAITKMGVQPFWPSKLKIRGFVRVGGILEGVIYVIAVFLFVYTLLI